MKTSLRLLESVKDIWDSYNKHPFVLGIEKGNLPKDKFRFYMIQDYLYLEEYAKTFAIGVAKASNLKMANLFSKYISVMNGELDVHKGYLAMLEVTEDEIKSTPRSIDNISYTSYMMRVAYEYGEVEILTAIISCAYSYEIIAKNIYKNNPDSIKDSFYGPWIRGYISPEYSQDNKILLDTLDEITSNYTEEQIKHLEEIFILCSRYEYMFWDMSWNMKI